MIRHLFTGSLLLFSLAVAAQNPIPKGIQAELRVSPEGDSVIYAALCRNNEEFTFELVAKLSIVRKDPAGNWYDSTLVAPFTMGAESEQLLYASKIDRLQVPEYGLILQVYQNGALIAKDAFPKNLLGYKSPTVDQQISGANPDTQQPDDKQDPSLSGGLLELNGFIIEATLTPAGQEFAQLFLNKWQNQSLPGDYTIKIEELPFRGRSTQLVIYLNEEEIFRRFIQPGYEFLDELSSALVGYIAQRVRNLQQTERDLQGDLKGSGIY